MSSRNIKYSKMFRFFFAIVVLVFFSATVNGEILCYSCISQGGGDDTCVKNPAAVSNSIIKCKYKYCTIRRLEYTSEPGTIYSFLRGCEEEPLPNGENPGEDITVWAQSCNFADLCNVGDGLSELTKDSINGATGDNTGNVIIVPASAGSSAHGKFHVLLLILAIHFCKTLVI